MMSRKTTILMVLMLMIWFGCKQYDHTNNASKKPTILTTTGMIKDAVVNLLGDNVEVTALMGSGVDPHLYQASPGDLASMNKADVVVYNGLFLEGKLDNILKKLAVSKNVINFSDGINKADLLAVTNAQYEGEIYDPHIWFDIDVWKQGITALGNDLSTYYPQFKDTIAQRQSEYLKQLDALKIDLIEQISIVPEEKRLMVTSHDAFHYFGRMLNIRVEALQGISTATDFGLQDRKQLVDLIIKEAVNAIFIESSVGDKPIKAIIADCQKSGKMVSLGGTLYSDAMGADGTAEGTYIGMLQHNVSVVTKGLSNGN